MTTIDGLLLVRIKISKLGLTKAADLPVPVAPITNTCIGFFKTICISFFFSSATSGTPSSTLLSSLNLVTINPLFFLISSGSIQCEFSKSTLTFSTLFEPRTRISKITNNIIPKIKISTKTYSSGFWNAAINGFLVIDAISPAIEISTITLPLLTTPIPINIFCFCFFFITNLSYFSSQ